MGVSAKRGDAGWAVVALLLMALLAFLPAVGVGHASSPTPSLQVTSGLICPGQVALHSGTAYIPDYDAFALFSLPSPYTGTPTSLATIVEAWNVAFNAAGNLWVNSYDGYVYGFSSPSAGTPFATIEVAAYSIAFDSSGNLWASTTSGLMEFTSSTLAAGGTITSANAAVTISGVYFSGIAFDSHGNLWGTTETAVNEVAAPITDSSTAVSVTTETSSTGRTFSYAWGVAFDSAGNMWVADEAGGAVYEYASPYTGAPVQSITSGLKEPYYVTINGPNVWVSDCGNSAVYEYAGLAPLPTPPRLHIPSNDVPGTLALTTYGGTKVTGTLVSYEGARAVYNIPSINQTLLDQELAQGDFALFPNAVTICSTTVGSQAFVMVSGFSSLTWGGSSTNSTEFVFTGWESFLASAAGWPSVPACTS